MSKPHYRLRIGKDARKRPVWAVSLKTIKGYGWPAVDMIAETSGKAIWHAQRPDRLRFARTHGVPR